MLISRRSTIWNGIFLAALLLSLLSTAVTLSPARADTAPPDGDDRPLSPLAVEVMMAELPAVNKSAEVTIVVSSTERAADVRVAIVGSEGMRIDGERGFVIDLAAGEARTLQASVTPEVAGNYTVAANVSLDVGDGNVWGDSDAVYFNSGDGTASEGYSYMGDPMSIAAVPGPGNTMDVKSEAFADGSMPAIAVDEDMEIPADAGEPGGQDDDPRAGDMALAPGMLTIRGNVGMTDRDGDWHRQRMLVELLTSSGAHIAIAYSDVHGHFAFNVNNPGAFRIRAWAYYRHGSMTIGAIRVVGNGQQTPSAFNLAGWNYRLPVMGPFPDGEVNVGAWQPNPNASGSRAFWIYQDMIDGFFSTWNAVPPGMPAGSRQPDGVTVEWQPGSNVFPHYNPTSRRAKLKDVDANTSSTVLHEYGHAIMHNVYGTLPINDCPSPHHLEKVSGKNCAWTEGWPDFFAIYVQGTPFNAHGCTLPCTPSPVANLELRITFPTPWDGGDLVEGNVAASLWDFIDAPADGYDKTTPAITPFWKIWDVFYNHNHNTFREFWDQLSADVNYTTFAQAQATLYQNKIDYGWPAICADYPFELDDSVPWTLAADPNAQPYQRAFCTDNDADWYRLEVEPGVTYVIETANLSTALNGTIADTTLTLHRWDSTMTELAYDDDGGSENLASRIVYTATTSDSLLVAARQKYGLGNPFYHYTIDFTVVVPNVAPSVTAPTNELMARQMLDNPGPNAYTLDVQASWTASDSDDGIDFQTLRGQVDGGGFSTVAPNLLGTVRVHSVPMKIGTTNQLQVSATDFAGASSGYATGESFALLGSQEDGFTYEGNWTKVDLADAWDGAYMTTSAPLGPSLAAASDATATFTFTGTSLALIGMRAPDGGYARIYVDGVERGMADYYATEVQHRQVMFVVNGLSSGDHKLEVHWIPDNNVSSSGYRLYLDGAVVLD